MLKEMFMIFLKNNRDIKINIIRFLKKNMKANSTIIEMKMQKKKKNVSMKN